MLRGRIPTTRILFFLSLIILFSLTQPLTAQSNDGEAPLPPPSPCFGAAQITNTPSSHLPAPASSNPAWG